jgi:hypothetical protein
LGVSFMLAHLSQRIRCGRCLSKEVRLLTIADDSARWYTSRDDPLA